jgi:hypothetical protein
MIRSVTMLFHHAFSCRRWQGNRLPAMTLVIVKAHARESVSDR